MQQEDVPVMVSAIQTDRTWLVSAERKVSKGIIFVVGKCREQWEAKVKVSEQLQCLSCCCCTFWPHLYLFSR